MIDTTDNNYLILALAQEESKDKGEEDDCCGKGCGCHDPEQESQKPSQ